MIIFQATSTPVNMDLEQLGDMVEVHSQRCPSLNAASRPWMDLIAMLRQVRR